MTIRLTAALGFLLFLSVSAPATAEGPKEWDRDKLLRLTDSLVSETGHIHRAMVKHIPEHVPIGGESTIDYVIFQDAAEIHRRALALNGGIRAGQGRRETEPVVRRLVASVEHARRDAVNYEPLRAVQTHTEKAGKLLERILEYY